MAKKTKQNKLSAFFVVSGLFGQFPYVVNLYKLKPLFVGVCFCRFTGSKALQFLAYNAHQPARQVVYQTDRCSNSKYTDCPVLKASLMVGWSIMPTVLIPVSSHAFPVPAALI